MDRKRANFKRSKIIDQGKTPHSNNKLARRSAGKAFQDNPTMWWKKKNSGSLRTSRLFHGEAAEGRKRSTGVSLGPERTKKIEIAQEGQSRFSGTAG
jgi:hypothetical protein